MTTAADILTRHSFTDDVIACLMAHSPDWVPAPDLAKVGGFCGWRTRVSEARQRLERDGKGTIEWNGQVRGSAYRFLGYQPLGRSAETTIPQRSLF